MDAHLRAARHDWPGSGQLQVTLRLGRRGLRAEAGSFQGHRRNCMTERRASAAPHCAGRGLWQPPWGSPVGRSGNRGDPPRWWPALPHTVAKVTGRVCVPVGARALHTQLTEPFTVRDPGALRELTTLILPSSTFLAAAAPGLGLRRQTWVRRGAGEGRGAAGQRGRGTFQENLLPAEVPGAQVKVAGEQGWSLAAWAIRKQALAEEPEAAAGLAPRWSGRETRPAS